MNQLRGDVELRIRSPGRKCAIEPNEVWTDRGRFEEHSITIDSDLDRLQGVEGGRRYVSTARRGEGDDRDVRISERNAMHRDAYSAGGQTRRDEFLCRGPVSQFALWKLAEVGGHGEADAH